MKILVIGDIVGRPGRDFLRNNALKIKRDLAIDFFVANGENSAGGSGITLDTAKDLFEAGIDVVTSGDHVFKKKEIKEVFSKYSVIRPLNYGRQVLGQGYIIKQAGDSKVAVINLLGRVFMQPADCPFNAVMSVLEDIKKCAKIIIVDFHAEATSEKVAMGYFLADKVTAVLGTHTHIPTADERIINGTTAYITDLGMTGSFDSVLGREKANVIEKFVTNMPVKFNLSQNDVRMQGVVIDADETTGHAVSVRRVEIKG
ncbi:MAG: TIGR00282 family metallophosphoesterase [Candidatus Omnitrophica bacterium]|nr:TIGR00282 family metallophosphoesterase [Candidatus Omnitrophota bacterium]MDD5081650.1 TIGR00282 family metallophosphoesterase [Candidatus Omnitrophota bacterium]MDD5441370.1 TIGR00282 family metallophosphoesterase [Candidatus Omnitrophota bacterium]